ncbi:MAG: cytochrome bd ubiquinol oxidase subunit [Solirubrobacteraceae bacterium]|nr:cytochrome bd ubiquinol oxidase subunit [Solirubrobacteraceae bacterium]
MTLADACLALIVVGMTAYLVLGGADFGAGFWDLTAGSAARGHRLRALAQRSMGPVWEANHVWLIFVLVVAWTAFPVAFGSVMSTLYVPLFLAAAGIILRGLGYALREEATSVGQARVLGAAFALASVLTPFCLGAAVGAIGSGRVPAGDAAGAPLGSWLNPASIALGVLAVIAGACLAAVYMAADAARDGLDDLQQAMRRRALGAGVAAGAVALGSLLVLRSDAPRLYDGLTSGRALVCVLGSTLAGATTLGLVWRACYGAARFVAAAAVAAITVGWALAQYPDLLPGRLTVGRAAAPHATLVALLWAAAVGIVLIAPALVALYRLAARGEIDEPLEEIDRRFAPPGGRAGP